MAARTQISDIEQKLNQALEPFQVVVRFSQKSVEDLMGYAKEQQEQILVHLVSRAKKGPLLKPRGLGEPLHGALRGFTKIKPKYLKLRIIYRPMENGLIRMEVIAIGPREREKVYQIAAERLLLFKTEMANS